MHYLWLVLAPLLVVFVLFGDVGKKFAAKKNNEKQAKGRYVIKKPAPIKKDAPENRKSTLDENKETANKPVIVNETGKTITESDWEYANRLEQGYSYVAGYVSDEVLKKEEEALRESD